MNTDTFQIKPSSTTLFDKYGGVSVIIKVVKTFQYEILHRPHLARYFQGLDLTKMTDHSILYISFALGKPLKVYTSREMNNAHIKFKISGLHYDEIADVLKDSLSVEGFNEIDIKAVMNNLEKVRYIFIAE
jgi:hemoglobin